MIGQPVGRLEDAEVELREAFSLCRGLKERGLVTWTASELTKIQILREELKAREAQLARIRRAHERRPVARDHERQLDLAVGSHVAERDRAVLG